jgi:choice-of-anchor A domain-containing protein
VSEHPNTSTREREVGMTFIEVLVTVSILGLMTAVVAAAVTVVFRDEKGVADIVGDSHDVQQAVNYFHLDVESGPAASADYRVTPGARGTGCSDAGDANVMQFDTDADEASAQPDRRIAYRLTTTGSVAELDRYECAWNGSSWVEIEVRNIADRLDGSGGPAVTISVVESAGLVDRVVMQFAQSVSDEEVSAAPRAETGLLPFGIGDCAGNPLDAALGFGTFIESDVFLDNTVTSAIDVEGTLAVGGVLGWRGDPIPVASSDTNGTNGFPNVNLYASGIDWSYGTAPPPPGILEASTSSSDNIVLGVPYDEVPGVGPNPTELYESGFSPTGARIEIDNGANVFTTAAYPIDFTTQFDILRACAGALASLPDGADAEHVTVENSSGGPYPGWNNPGGDELWLDLGGARTQVLNIPEEWLGPIDTIRIAGGALSSSNPLVVNIAEQAGDSDDDLVFDIATPDWTTFGDYEHVLYNFTNLSGTITIEQDVYGTIYAPFASVVTKGDVHGAVIATQWTHEGGVVDNVNMFDATIDWDTP